MKLYYTIWNIILMLPLPIKILIEMILLLLAAAIIWPICRILLFLLSKVASFFNLVILGGIRYMLVLFSHGSEKVFELDEKIGQRGKKIDGWLKQKGKGVKEKKYRDLLKKKGVMIILAIIYIAGILPVFRIDRYVSEFYIKEIYFVNQIFGNLEKRLTRGIEAYPVLIKEKEEREEVPEVTEQSDRETIYLKLKDDVAYANLRNEASMDGSSLCTISKEDEIVYQDIYEFDTKRYWLKVTITTKDNIEGWISAKVIQEDIVDTLNLQ